MQKKEGNGSPAAECRESLPDFPEKGTESCREASDFKNAEANPASKASLSRIYEWVCGLCPEGMVPVRKGGRWGFADREGKEAAPCVYEEVVCADVGNYSLSSQRNTARFALQVALQVMKSGRWGLVGKDGMIVIPFICEDADAELPGIGMGILKAASDGDIVVLKAKRGGLWGFVDMAGREVVPCIYERAGDFRHGVAPVERDGLCGLVDMAGKEIAPCIYGELGDFGQGVACAERDGRWGFIDTTGKEVVPCVYDDAEIYLPPEGRKPAWFALRVMKNGRWGVADTDGRIIVPCAYEYLFSRRHCCRDTVTVKKDGRWGLVDRTGKEIIPCIYEYIVAMDNGNSRVFSDRKWGIVDRAGREIAPCVYECSKSVEVEICYPGLCPAGNRIRAKKRGRWGLVDTVTGTEVVPCVYESLHLGDGEAVLVSKDGRWGVLDRDGKEHIPCIYKQWSMLPCEKTKYNFEENFLRPLL